MLSPDMLLPPTPPAFALSEPDTPIWDGFVQQHPYGHLLQSSAWGALKQQVGWKVRRVVLAGSDGLLAGAQLLIRRRLGLSAIYLPRGPLPSDDPAADAQLLAALDGIARRERAVFLRLEPNVLERTGTADALHNQLVRTGFQPAEPMQPRSTIHLQLNAPPDQLFAAMSKGHRADIRRAQRIGVTVRTGKQQEDLARFYSIMEETAARAEFAIHSRAYYQAAWELFSAQSGAGEHTCLLLAEREGSTLAAALIFAWAGTGLYFYGGSSEEGLKSGANHLLQWQALQWAYAQGCGCYDFWGIPDALGRAALSDDEQEQARLEALAKTDPLYGVFRFKKGFGGQIVRYLPAYDRVYMPWLYTIWRRRFGR